ncbi:hypothetical protein C0Q70_07292 [Pomacea canaliculata]|uniref:Uncharacterized protein n=1 Tax=Pomacea canaliculata TaxID=400727 RepID=A0A2T7PEM4_POMCA|nr:uncharacterized protein LOC112561846 [Pomacea canaliculata]PVD31868.1 hypothetical protein C0Q70_07292 [Pomacea canaliculata]
MSAKVLFYRIGLVCSVTAFVLMFVAFTSPFWYKSWTRVHSSFGNIGLWHVCLYGFIIPTDPAMKSYVGCWWIHSEEFVRVASEIMPPWFRIIQLLCVLTLLMDLVVMILLILYLVGETHRKIYEKDVGRMFIIIAILMLLSAFLVFLIALIFAEMSHDSSWMPRPWMNYLSWSYGCCVLSGFFGAFGGMVIFVLGLIYKDKSHRDEDQLDSAAEMRKRQAQYAAEKEEEAMKSQPPPQVIPTTRFTPREMTAPQPMKKPGIEPRVGESFV